MTNRNQYVPEAGASELRTRRVIDFEREGIRDVLALGRYEYHSVRPGLSTHSHPDAVEICYLERGRQVYRLHDCEYLLTGGDVFVVPPGEEHDTGDRHEDCGVLYWLILRLPDVNKRLLDLSARDSAALSEKLLSLPSPHFAGRPVLKIYFDRLFDLYAMPDETLRPLKLKHQLLGCILEVLRCGYELQHRQLSPAIDCVVRKIQSCPEEDFLLAELAAEAGLSLSRFKAKFKSEVGIAPREFILREKVERAKVFLRQSEQSVTTIAMSLGFSSSQYFATVFKRFTQHVPGSFRDEALRSGSVSRRKRVSL